MPKHQLNEVIEAAQETVPIESDTIDEYILWQADQIAQKISQNERYRPARFISMDIGDPMEIATSSIHSTPESTKKMNIFTHAVKSLFDQNEHIQGDIFEPLPFPDNSITLITCMDGWPFYFSFEGFSDDEVQASVFKAAETITGWYQKLTYGGKIVIFPWTIKNGGAESAEYLEQTLDHLSLILGHGVNQVRFHRATLIDFMSDADRETAEKLSEVFSKDMTRINGLVIEKGRRSLVKQHAEKIGGRLLRATEVQNPDLLDPMQ